MFTRYTLFCLTAIIFFTSAVTLFASENENLPAPPPYREIGLIEKTKEMDHVLFLIQKQLITMHEVARWKWNQKAEIEDFHQEQQMLTKMGKLAVAYGLNKEWALKFFHAQMNAAKMIQVRDFEYWNKHKAGNFEAVADLHTEIRPYLDRLTKELLKALVEVSPYLKEGDLELLILDQPPLIRASDLIEEDVWHQAIAPLYEYAS